MKTSTTSALSTQMGSDFIDFLIFNGSLGQLNTVLINPYNGQSVHINQQVNISNEGYNGLGEYDYLFMTDLGDALFGVNSLGQLMFENIEEIWTGEGNNIINLASLDVEIGDVIVYAGNGHDILWTNIGNDIVYGAGGNDNINSGPGQDEVYGEDDNDLIHGGDDNDTLQGGSGNDVVYGDKGNDLIIGGIGDDVLYGGSFNPEANINLDKLFTDTIVFPSLKEGTNISNLKPPGDPALGIADNNLRVDFQAQAEITFRKGFAGYNNSLGVYRIAADGTIQAAHLLWANTKTAGIDVTHTVDLPVGENGGAYYFFIIANGFNVNNGYNGLDITDPGNIQFIYNYGMADQRFATINDSGQNVSMVYNDGQTIRLLNGHDYHTTERGESTALNSDGQMHVVSGLLGQGQDQTLRIGFEDLYGGGDRDFEDVLFDVNIVAQQTIVEDQGNDRLIGGAGDDRIYGERGNDFLVIGEGLDRAWGGHGRDTFAFEEIDNKADLIYDFEIGANGDRLNITNILHDFNLSGNLENLISFVDQGNDTAIMIKTSNSSNGAFMHFATLVGVDVTLNQLVNNNQIITDQFVTI